MRQTTIPEHREKNAVESIERKAYAVIANLTKDSRNNETINAILRKVGIDYV